LGTFLRSFSFGYVRQLDAVVARFLPALAAAAPLLPGARQVTYVDVDDTVTATYGYAKQGTGYGYSGIKGLNALIATASTPTGAPVITATRLRKGSVNSARGAARLIGDALAVTRACGGDPKAGALVVVRADSAFYNHAVIGAARFHLRFVHLVPVGNGSDQGLAVTGHDLLHGVGKVVPQVPTVGDLHRVGRTRAGGLGVRTGPIPADHLDPGPGSQPLRDRGGSPVRQDVDRAVGAHIDHDGAVDVPPPEREVVDPHQSQRGGRRERDRPQQPQQGRSTHHGRQPDSQPGPSTTGQERRHSLQHPLQPQAPPPVTAGQPLDLLHERAPRAPDLTAQEPADPHVDQHLPFSDGQITDPALVPAVHPPGHHPTARADRPGRRRPGPDLDHVADRPQCIDSHAPELREHHRNIRITHTNS
jgi:hypothetical protein